jgi:hypothetical protein
VGRLVTDTYSQAVESASVVGEVISRFGITKRGEVGLAAAFEAEILESINFLFLLSLQSCGHVRSHGLSMLRQKTQKPIGRESQLVWSPQSSHDAVPRVSFRSKKQMTNFVRHHVPQD